MCVGEGGGTRLAARVEQNCAHIVLEGAVARAVGLFDSTEPAVQLSAVTFVGTLALSGAWQESSECARVCVRVWCRV